MAIGDFESHRFLTNETIAPAAGVQLRLAGVAINYGSTGCEWRIKTTTDNNACQITNDSGSAKGGCGVVMISGADGDTGSGGMPFIMLDGDADGGGSFLEIDGSFGSTDNAWGWTQVVKE